MCIRDSYSVVLASKSPRRRELLSHIITDFKIVSTDINEEFSPHLKINAIAHHIAEKKANFYLEKIKANEIYITADTIVILNNKILGKPADEKDAFNMLKSLSDKSHLVHTGVSIIFNKKIHSFYDETKVTFYPLSNEEIKDYWTSPYTKSSIDYVLSSTKNSLNEWVTVKTNVKEDYKKLHNLDVDILDGVAIMADTDQSKKRSISYFQSIYFSAN